MKKKPSVERDTGPVVPCWWGIHYDVRGIERERKTFRTRDLARIWVKAQKAKEHGDLKEGAA